MLDQRVEQRRAIFEHYQRGFSQTPGIEPMPEAGYGRGNRWLNCFLTEEKDFGCDRDQLIASLNAADIETSPVWKPMHQQVLFEGCQCYGGTVTSDVADWLVAAPAAVTASLRRAALRSAGMWCAESCDFQPRYETMDYNLKLGRIFSS